MRTIILAVFLSVAGVAIAAACPETHYPCGNSSCCPK